LGAGALLAALGAGGCDIVGFGAHVVGGGPGPTRVVEPAYEGLAGERVAVLVSVPNKARRKRVRPAKKAMRVLHRRLRAKVSDIQLLPVKRCLAFQRAHPSWLMTPQSRRFEALEATRILQVDVSRYTLHADSGPHVWQGLMAGRVGVAERGREGLAFAREVEARFPPDTRVGVLDANPEAIESGMLERFARAVGRLFHRYEIQGKEAE
jgi:hypothetical protein